MPQSPNQDTLRGVFHSPAAQQPAPGDRRMGTVFDYYSVADDANGRAKKLSAEATRELERASAKAQRAAGGIELYSGKFYAACTFGGLLACVRQAAAPGPGKRLAPPTPGPPALTTRRASPTRP